MQYKDALNMATGELLEELISLHSHINHRATGDIVTEARHLGITVAPLMQFLREGGYDPRERVEVGDDGYDVDEEDDEDEEPELDFENHRASMWDLKDDDDGDK